MDLGPEGVPLEALVEAVQGAGYSVGVEKSQMRIGGMTCAACVSNVERALRGVPGVLSAGVNLATEQATVDYIPGVASLPDFCVAVDEVGYTLESTEEQGHGQKQELERLAKGQEVRALRTKFVFAASVAAVIFLGSFDGFPWTSQPHGPDVLPFPTLGPGDPGAVLGRVAVLHLGTGCAQAPDGQHAHPYSPGHQRSLLL